MFQAVAFPECESDLASSAHLKDTGVNFTTSNTLLTIKCFIRPSLVLTCLLTSIKHHPPKSHSSNGNYNSFAPFNVPAGLLKSIYTPVVEGIHHLYISTTGNVRKPALANTSKQVRQELLPIFANVTPIHAGTAHASIKDHDFTPLMKVLASTSAPPHKKKLAVDLSLIFAEWTQSLVHCTGASKTMLNRCDQWLRWWASDAARELEIGLRGTTEKSVTHWTYIDEPWEAGLTSCLYFWMSV